jgi:hypothetical protein
LTSLWLLKSSQVACRQVVCCDEWLLTLNNVISAGIGMIGSFNVIENDNRAVSPSSSGCITSSFSELEQEEWDIHILGQRKPNSVVESEPQGWVRVFTAFAAVEEVGLEVF